MAGCTNNPQVTNAYRSAIEDRATWFYLLLKAAEELGGDPEKIAEKAITEFGKNKGKKLGNIGTPSEFVDALAVGYGEGAFAMKKGERTDEQATLRFHHCALVDAWKNLGCTREEISKLCRLARYGDYAMISNFPQLQLDFPQVIADGGETCEMVITYKKEG